MTRSKHILALLISLVALAVLAPAASAATSPNPYRWGEPNGIRYGSQEPNPLKRCSCELTTYRIKVVGSQFVRVKIYKVKAIVPQASRFNG